MKYALALIAALAVTQAQAQGVSQDDVDVGTVYLFINDDLCRSKVLPVFKAAAIDRYMQNRQIPRQMAINDLAKISSNVAIGMTQDDQRLFCQYMAEQLGNTLIQWEW